MHFGSIAVHIYMERQGVAFWIMSYCLDHLRHRHTLIWRARTVWVVNVFWHEVHLKS